MATPLPNYQCASYRRQAPLWAYLDDVFVGSEAWLSRNTDGTVSPNAKTATYLPKEPAELPENYKSRLARSPFSDRFAQAIRDFVGLILTNGVKFIEVPDIIQEHWKNIDNAGMPGDAFVAQVAIAAMRRGHSFIMVDASAVPAGNVISISEAASRRPYWIHIQAPQVINWRYIVVGGQKILTQATICQTQMIPDGEYGEREETTYLVLRPGRFDTYLIEGQGEQAKAIHLPQRSGVHGIVKNGRVEPFRFIPLVCDYGGDRQLSDGSEGFFESRPPLKVLADLNIAHYQTYSDHRSKIHRCCFPVPVRLGAMGDQGDLVLGPDTVVDVPPGGDFGWREPNASSLDKSRQELQDLETAMDFLSGQYLIKPGDRQAAAVSRVQAAKVESSLYLFAQAIVQGVNQALQIHAAYLGLPSGGRIELQTKFYQQNQDAQMLLGYLSLFEKLQQLPPDERRSLLELLKEKGFLSEEFDTEGALKRATASAAA